MTTKELIKQLSNYSPDTKISNINCVFENMLGEVSLTYKESKDEIRAREQYLIDAQRRHQEEFDKRGEITSFANRW